MVRHLLLLTSLLLFGCSHKLEDNWKTIEIGDYLFDFPNDFSKVEPQCYDSYCGYIKGDSITFDFDFGVYGGSPVSDSKEWIECFQKPQIDTLDDLLRTITVPVEPCRGVTGVTIWKLDDFTKSKQSFLSLHLGARNLSETQKSLALKIYNTGRHK